MISFIGDDLTGEQDVTGYSLLFTSSSGMPPGIRAQSNPLDFFNQSFAVPIDGFYTLVDSFFDLGFGSAPQNEYTIQIVDAETGRPIPLSSIEVSLSPSWGDQVLLEETQFRISDFKVSLSMYNNSSLIYNEQNLSTKDTLISHHVSVQENLSPLSSGISLDYYNPIRSINSISSATLITNGQLFDTYSFSFEQFGQNADPERFFPEGVDHRGGALFYVKATPAPVVFLDFDTAIPFSFTPIVTTRPDALLSEFNPFLEEIPISSPLSNFSDADKESILYTVRSIFQNSDIPVHITLDEPDESSDFTRVMFSEVDLNYFINGFSGRLFGEAFEGVDQFDRVKNSSVGIWMNNGDNLGHVGEVVAHEVGHALGAQHINPLYSNSIEVMDYDYSFIFGGSGVTPKFHETPSRVVHPPIDFPVDFIPPSDGTHNPTYHILKYAVGVSDEYLEERGLLPGTFDVLPKPDDGKQFFTLSVELEDGIKLDRFGIIRYEDDLAVYENLAEANSGDFSIDFYIEGGIEFAFAGSTIGRSDLDVLVSFDSLSEESSGNPSFGQVIGYSGAMSEEGLLFGSATLIETGSIRADETGYIPPVARPDFATTTVDESVTISLLDNDFDPNGRSLVIVDVSNGNNGSVVVSGDGVVEYIPVLVFSGSDTFSYRIAKVSGVSSSASVTIEVAAEDTVAQDDNAFTFVGRRVMVDPLSNDSGATENVSIQSVEDPLNGQVYISADRSVLIFEPDPLFVGTDSFRYTISQGAGDVRSAFVSVDVGNWDHAGAVTLSTGQRNDRVTQYNLKELFSGLYNYGPVGDLNGDSIDDRVVYEGNTAALNFSGRFYEFQDIYTGTNGFEFSDENGTVRRVGSAGDFNGDGIDDLAVWWSEFDPGPPFTTSESVFVVYGKSGSFKGTVNLDNLDPDDGIRVTGFRNTVEALDLDVYPIKGGGDFNNDGFDDLVIGSPGSSFSTDSFRSGVTFVLLGSDMAKSDSTFNLFSSGDLVLIDGGVPGVTSGLGVDWLGDLNSDGFDDLGILQLSTGVVGDIVFGDSLTESNIVTLGDGSESLRVEGARGTSLSSAKDINGDLFTDYVFVADGVKDAVYLVLGHEDLEPGKLDVSSLNLGNNAFKFVGHADGVDPLLARGAGDLDGDGFNDLAIATIIRASGSTNVDIVFGGRDNLMLLDASDGIEDGIIEVGEKFDRLAPEPEEVEKNVLIGESASDVLVGSEGPDVIVSGAGTYDKMRGGGSADQFIFGSEAENGVRERSAILDYEVGIDEIVLIEGASAASVRETSSQVVIFLEGDRDAIYVRGDGVTADNITIVTDDVFEFI